MRPDSTNTLSPSRTPRLRSALANRFVAAFRSRYVKARRPTSPSDPAQRMAVSAGSLGMPVHRFMRDIQPLTAGKTIQQRACRIPGEGADRSLVIGQIGRRDEQSARLHDPRIVLRKGEFACGFGHGQPLPLPNFSKA